MREASVRAFAPADAPAARALFIAVNRELAPASMAAAFEGYIARCLREEIDRIADYYGERGGGFWMADRGGPAPVGMFGLEPASPGAMELRRMYVHPAARRGGVARTMLAFAEDECRRRGASRLVLSTSELQGAALALYRAAGYRETGVAVAREGSNRTVGGGLRRFAFAKALDRPGAARPRADPFSR